MSLGSPLETTVRIVVLALGGALGVNARYWLGVWMDRCAVGHWATFAINVSGSFAIGFLGMTLARWLPHPNVRLLVLTGFLGGYTTFSTFSLESVMFWERDQKGLALLNMVGSVAAGFVAAILGIALARDIVIPRWEHALGLERPVDTRAASPSRDDRRLDERDAGSPDLELPPGTTVTGLGNGAKEVEDGTST